MLRASLIVALLAGLGALGTSYLVVGKKIADITTQLAETEKQKSDAQAAEGKAKSDAKKSQERERAVAKERDEFKTKFETAAADSTLQRKRGSDLETALNKVTQERNDAQGSLAAWNTLGLAPDQVKTLKSELVVARAERDAVNGEKTILLRNLTGLESKLSRYEGKDKKVTLPVSAKGKVLAVDPKFDFVVLDVGFSRGAVEQGELLVSRDGKLVAKLKLVRVQEDRSIANVLPGWKQADVVTGDSVQPSL